MQKLREALQSMRNPKKDQTANAGKFSYKYASLDAVLEIVKTALAEHELGLRQGIRKRDDDWVLETCVFGDDGAWYIMDERPIFVSPAPQDQGSYETYMRRYALLTAFGLAGEDDTDGKGAQETAKSKKGDYLDPIREALPKYAKAVGLSVQQATENILAYIGASDMKELTEDGVPTVLEFMRDEAKAFRGE